MLRLVLAAIALFLLLIGGAAAALVYFWGWKGFLAFPFIVALFIWLGVVVVRQLFQRVLLGLFSLKSRVLRGATMTVHSILPVAKPIDLPVSDRETNGETIVENDEMESDEVPTAASSEHEEPRDYFDVDLTIRPKDEDSSRVWEPSELMLTAKKISSLAELQGGECELGTTREVKVWDGSQFGADDPGKYPGEQRLKITFAVKPGTSTAWLHYYSESIGALEFPRWSE
jgi:hypothetical protein